MYAIYENKSIDKIWNKLPLSIQKKYEFWKNIIQLNGLEGLQQFPGFHDEKLVGKRKGERSSRLNLKYRVIYTAEKEVFHIYVIDITPHKY